MSRQRPLCNVGRDELQKGGKVLRQNDRKRGKFLLPHLERCAERTPSNGGNGENAPFFLVDFHKGMQAVLSGFFRVGIIPVL